MLYFYSGTDREKARAAMDAAVKKISKKGSRVVRITDANAPADLAAALGGRGMFDEGRLVVLNGVFANEEMRAQALAALPDMRASADPFFILEEKLDAATRKQIEKYAEESKRFDSASAKKGGDIFAVANALRRADKKSLWVNYQRQLAADAAPEAIHGVLFWAAKDMYLKGRTEAEQGRAKRLIAELAELPHESRRRGLELEYALELFVLQ
ncbi:hypothetical protein HY971_02655 [Candidatus Kaiserbacteria bacterium]|nr:hypothetical protein [Candidatus Kaiserbacteria bacterium]